MAPAGRSRRVTELEKWGHRAKAIDLPGQGQDQTPLGKVTLNTMVDRIVAALTELPGRGRARRPFLGWHGRRFRQPRRTCSTVQLRALLLHDKGRPFRTAFIGGPDSAQPSTRSALLSEAVSASDDVEIAIKMLNQS